MRTVFGAIVKVWEIIIIIVTMIYFATTKFTMILFAGTADPEAYLDWELAVKQKFNSHLVPAEHRVRLATSEFTSFPLFWWNYLCNAGNAAAMPQLGMF